MHLSISNSESTSRRTNGPLRNATILLLIGSITLITAVEVGTRSLVYRMSAGLSRIHEEGKAAAHIHREGETYHRVLLIGNSLLLSDVDMEVLGQGLKPEWSSMRYAIEQTTFYDWFYGLRRLIGDGSRPDVIGICFEPRHLVQSSIHDEIFAHYLLQKRDIADVSQKLRLNPAGSIDLLFGNLSTFYALRKELRKVLLQRLIPGLPNLTGMIVRSPKPLPDLDTMRIVGKQRMEAIRNLAGSSGIRVILIMLPPLLPEYGSALEEVGREVAMPVLVPLDSNQISAENYETDGYHLNASGRKQFTNSLLPLLQKELKR